MIMQIHYARNRVSDRFNFISLEAETFEEERVITLLLKSFSSGNLHMRIEESGKDAKIIVEKKKTCE